MIHLERHVLFDRHALLVGRLPCDLADASTSAFEDLWKLQPAQSNEILIHGRIVPIPRWQQAYWRDYAFSGTTSQALAIPKILSPFLAWVCEAIDIRLNGLLLNWYDANR